MRLLQGWHIVKGIKTFTTLSGGNYRRAKGRQNRCWGHYPAGRKSLIDYKSDKKGLSW